ncbi:MAG TPA: hypothetical protein PLX23_08760 [Candidatus Hydrogenedens sp.]|nr:hypothetical protein [Candidatus Hydrogenedens sp.]
MIIVSLYSVLTISPEVITLNLEPIVQDVIVEDINQDDLKDLIFLICEEDGYNKKLVAFYQQQGVPKFSESSSYTFPITVPCSVLFTTKMEKNKHSIVIAYSDGFNIYNFQGNSATLEKSVTFPNIFPYNSKEPVILKNISYDLDDDGTDEWFISTAHGITILKNYAPISDVSFHIFHEIFFGNNPTLYYQFPVIFPITNSNNKLKPVAFWGDKELVLAHGDNWSSVTKIDIERKNPEKWDSTYCLGDVNKDGFPDILLTETQGTLNLKTNAYMYISEGKFAYPEQPQFEYKIKGAVCLPVVKDINGDKQDDLILFNIPIGLTNFINFFIRGKLSVDSKVFLSDGKQLPPKPSYQTNILMDAPEGKDQIAYAVDDFSGNGVLDIAFGRARNVLQINTSSFSEGVMKIKQWIKLDIPGFGLIKTTNINDNKSRDMIIHRPSGENKNRVDIIIF